jgi:hypothetical protein
MLVPMCSWLTLVCLRIWSGRNQPSGPGLLTDVR